MNLTEIAFVVVAALAGGLILTRFKHPPILGYILAGVLLGPSGLALVESREQVSILAELGVLLLLFVVGMELNVQTFKRAWVSTTLCTLLQILTSLCIMFLLAPLFGWSTGMALLLGFVVALSSTAVVVNMLENIGELRSNSGQFAIGVLIAQDLAIVPMILILRNLEHSLLDPALIVKLTIAIGLIATLIVYLSQKQRVQLPFKHLSKDKELTPLVSLAFCFATAAATGLIGLSAPYGAFLAGLVLGNTRERNAFLETTKPIQSTLLMVFFLSIGLLVDIQFILDHWIAVFTLLFVITIGKTALNIGILYYLRRPWQQSFLIGVVLAQLGEFAFLLTAVAHRARIVDNYGQRLIIALTVLSLAFSPIWLHIARRIKDEKNSRHVTLTRVLTLVFGPEIIWFNKSLSSYLKPRLSLWAQHTARTEELIPEQDEGEPTAANHAQTRDATQTPPEEHTAPPTEAS